MSIVLSILCCIIGIIATWIVARWQMKKSRITNYTIELYSVGKGLRSKFNKLQFSYDEKSILNEVMVYHGAMMNTGRNDVTIPQSGITLSLPTTWKILECSIGKRSDELVIGTCISEDKHSITFMSDIMKANEAFQYSILYEVEDNKRIKINDALKFSHRIPNTNIVKEKFSATSKSLHKYTVALLVVCIFFIIITFASVYFTPRYHTYDKRTGDAVCSYIDFKDSIRIAKRPVGLLFTNTKISATEFETFYELKPYKDIYNKIVLLFYCTITLISIAILLSQELSKNRKQQKIVLFLESKHQGPKEPQKKK